MPFVSVMGSGWRSNVRSGADMLAGSETDGLFLDFTDGIRYGGKYGSAVVRSGGLTTYSGNPLGLLTYSSPSNKWTRRGTGYLTEWTAGADLPFVWNTANQLIGILIESARTNLFLRSREIDNAAWTKITGGSGVAAVVSTTSELRPDGTTGARRVQCDCGNAADVNSRSAVRQSVTLVSGQPYATSFWIKAYSAGEVGKTVSLAFDAIGASTLTLPADWTRHVWVATSVGTAGHFILGARGTISPQTLDFLLDFTQVEQASAASSEIVTAGSTVARASDRLSLATSLFPNPTTDVTILAKFRRSNTLNPSRIAQLSNAGASDYTDMFIDSGGLTGLVDGAQLVSNGAGRTLPADTTHKVAVAATNGSQSAYLNGVKTHADTRAMSVAYTILQIGNSVGNQQFLDGVLEELAVIPRKWSDSELAAWTTP